MGRIITIQTQNESCHLLGFYSCKPQVVYATPPGTKHLAHITWLRPGATTQNQRSSIDYFLIGDNLMSYSPILKDSPIFLNLSQESPSTKEREFKHNPNYTFTPQGQQFTSLIRTAAAYDITVHNQGKPKPLINSPAEFATVPEIKGSTTLHRAGPARLEIEGKQSFNPVCALDLNLDLTTWCYTEVTPEGKIAPWNSCEYCYAGYKHSPGEFYPSYRSVISKELEEQIKEARRIRQEKGLQTHVLRLGKKTEFCIPQLRGDLLETLEACRNTSIKVVCPTKHLPFDYEIARMFKITNSVLPYSFGHNSLEAGACLHGNTTEWRFEQARLYKNAGVNIFPYIMIDPVKENGGPLFEKNFLRAIAEFANIQLIPIRVRYRALAEKVLGGWDSILGPLRKNLQGEMQGGYEASLDYTRLHIAVDSSIQKQIGNNNGRVRMCSHNRQCVWCGGCFIPEVQGTIQSTQPHKIHLDDKWPRKKKRNPGQLSFQYV